MPGSLTDLVAGIHHGIDADEAMCWVARLTEWDRYQGSRGIAAAADFVAGEAERAGLAGVEILNFPADGRTSWWTFTAPSSWTPRSARLSLPGRTALVDYPTQPYTLAAHSAAARGEAPSCTRRTTGGRRAPWSWFRPWRASTGSCSPGCGSSGRAVSA